jgi:hypothetical protein
MGCIQLGMAGESQGMECERMIRWLATAALVAACGDVPMVGPDDGMDEGEEDFSGDADSIGVDASTPDSPSPVPDAMSDGPITGGTLQLNDVSIVLPLPTTLAERNVGMLTASSAGLRGALLPRATYDAIDSEFSLSGVTEYADLRVVALRIDPCFAQLTPALDGSGCEAQLRLVLQAIPGAPGGPSETYSAIDSGIHTFYRLTRAELYELKDAIVALRLASSTGEALGPLAPHPIVVRQGLDGAFSTGLRALVLRVAGGANLTRVAAMKEGPTGWEFSMFDIARAEPAQISLRTIATLPAGTTSQEGAPLVINPLGVEFRPAPTGPDTFNRLADSSIADGLDPEARRAEFDALMRVENPHASTPDSAACANCHFTMLVKKRIAEPRFGLFDSSSPDAYVPPADVVAPADLQATLSNDPFDFNVHAFSYNGNLLAIAQRTVNESAAVLAYFAAASAP